MAVEIAATEHGRTYGLERKCGIVAGYGAGRAQQKGVRQAGRSLLACLVRLAASKVELLGELPTEGGSAVMRGRFRFGSGRADVPVSVKLLARAESRRLSPA